MSSTVHGTAVRCGDRGALLRGPSGSGKSDLALRCLSLAASGVVVHPFHLVADDRVELHPTPGGIEMRCPAPIRGLLEVRGLGPVRFGPPVTAPLSLLVDLVPHPADVGRLPPDVHEQIAGHPVPRRSLSPFEASAAVKLYLMLHGDLAASDA